MASEYEKTENTVRKMKGHSAFSGKVLSVFCVLGCIIACSSLVLAHDGDGDGKEGLAEAIHALQVVAGMIPVGPENTEQTCSDGADNDRDGYIDCDDYDCDGTAACVTPEDSVETCSDGVDNDGDGYVDCSDYSCAGVSTCIGPENTDQACSDGLDNDGDSFTDCDDWNCDGTAVCPR